MSALPGLLQAGVLLAVLGAACVGPPPPPQQPAAAPEPRRPASTRPVQTREPGFRPCRATRIPVFQASASDVFELELQADFETINISPLKKNARSPGTLRYGKPGSEGFLEIPIELRARGNSRFAFCAFRPLTLRFDPKPSDAVLRGVGKKLKVVTHCGQMAGDQRILGGSVEAQRERVLAEHYEYALLATLETATLSTRLSRIRYLDPHGTLLATDYGFLREPVKRAAERCGLEKADDDEVFTEHDPASWTQTQVLHRFLANADFSVDWRHNVAWLKDADGVAHFLPYDFDLTAIIRPEYHKNGNLTLEQHAERFAHWIAAAYAAPRSSAQLEELLAKTLSMQVIIEESLLAEDMKNRFREWHRLYRAALKEATRDRKAASSGPEP